MNGKGSIFVDTNMFIYLLEGNNYAAEALLNKDIHFSFITKIELLGNPHVDEKAESVIKELLSFHKKHGYTDEIESKAILLRKKYKIKIPDAIIASSALLNQIPLFTSDSEFKKIK
ncbi:MAG: PIN domain-containing protein [Chitinophagaceae bacterium]|nr:MAG: PIN domain-containing protein [Chitinophagaceae bacterium]